MRIFILPQLMLWGVLLSCGMISKFATASELCEVANGHRWDLSQSVHRRFFGAQHNTPLGVIGDLTNEVKGQLYINCKTVSKQIFAKMDGTLQEVSSHHSGEGYVVYKLPNVPGVGVSFDVRDPNQSWSPLKPEPVLLVTHNGPSLGIMSRLQFHIFDDIKSGNYKVAPMLVGSVWVQERSNPSNRMEPPIGLYTPEIEIIVDVHSCKLDVPAQVKLNSDISNTTAFTVKIDQCGGDVDVYTRFSDANEQAVSKNTLKNTGSAKGYALKIETIDGMPINIIPVGTNQEKGEVHMGNAGVGSPLSKEFQVRVVEDGKGREPGTLDFKTIVGVAYR